MNDSLQQLFQSNPIAAIALCAGLFLVYTLIGLIPLSGLAWVVYFLLTLPMRRNERARLFIDLLELGLREGKTPEAVVIQMSASGDGALGSRFHRLAGRLREGLRLSQALEHVPRLVPPRVSAVLRAGERLGDIQKVLPACRRQLTDGVSQVRGALNYVLLLAFVLTPASFVVPAMLRLKVIPAYQQVFAGLSANAQLPAFTRLIFGSNAYIILLQVLIVVFLWSCAIFYIGGPRLSDWLRRLAPAPVDWLLTRLPWRRNRLRRDFSSLLAVLLDSDVPEPEAVMIAGEAVANSDVSRRAALIRDALQKGTKLPEAIRLMDNSGEFRWRLANALQRGSGFVRALHGWHEALDAKAFQQEQAAAQITTTGLVLLNGFLVACVVIAVFIALIDLLNNAVLW
jgi:type II secretory pathway component PulF